MVSNVSLTIEMLNRTADELHGVVTVSRAIGDSQVVRAVTGVEKPRHAPYVIAPL
jgi:hypothetical protein